MTTPPRWALILFVAISLLALRAAAAAPLADRPGEPERLYRLGVSLQGEGRVAEAIEAYRACLRLEPSRAQAYLKLKEAYGSSGRTLDQVLEELRERAERDGSDFISWNLLGVLYAKRGNWSDALAASERAVQVQAGDVDAWTNLGWILSELKHAQKARDAFGRALALDPRYGRAHAGMAGLHAEAGGDYEHAITEYLLALATEPDNPSYLYDLGWAYYRRGLTDQALDVLTRASSLKPDDPEGRAKLGWARLRRKEYRAAIDQFQEALRLEPTYAFARFGLAQALQREGHLDAAMAEYKRAWRQSRNDLYLIYLFGIYLQRSLWIIVLAVVTGMILTLMWLLRRRTIPHGTSPVREK